MIFDFAKKLFSDVSETVDEVKRINQFNDAKLIVDLIKRNSISCNKCSSLAAPIYDTENSYKCVKCSRQFHGRRHNITNMVNNLILKNSFSKSTSGIGLTYEKALKDLL